jgi:hypothetical protein
MRSTPVSRPNVRLNHIALHERLRLTGGRCPLCRSRSGGCTCGTCLRCRTLRRFEAVGIDLLEETHRASREALANLDAFD